MHLPELPTIFVKGDEERKVYFTVQARELIAAGWTEKPGETKLEAAPEEIKEEPKEEVKPAPRGRASKVKAELEVEE